ncbi:MAG: tyrosine-type recombinase/integrase [Methanotrichaceae archaeon]
MNKKLSIDWRKPTKKSEKAITTGRKVSSDFDASAYVEGYVRYLRGIGLKENTVKLYRVLIRGYLEEVCCDKPTPDEATDFCMSLAQKELSKSARNNYAAAITKYQEMIRDPVKLPFLKTNNKLPYFFEESDIQKIFNACSNFKHLCMLKVLFYGCLRSGELCNLDVQDYDSRNLTLRLNETKNGSDGIACINKETASLLDSYLERRPALTIKNRDPLFYTDYGNRWTPGHIHRMFLYYKEAAGVTGRGAVHCFSRHSPATLMVERGCELRSIQSILRHRDINTTLRYAHLSDKVKRQKYDQYLQLS